MRSLAHMFSSLVKPCKLFIMLLQLIKFRKTSQCSINNKRVDILKFDVLR